MINIVRFTKLTTPIHYILSSIILGQIRLTCYSKLKSLHLIRELTTSFVILKENIYYAFLHNKCDRCISKFLKSITKDNHLFVFVRALNLFVIPCCVKVIF